MFVWVDLDGGWSELREAGDLKRLHVALAGEGGGDAIERALGDFGHFDGEHAWLSVEALRAAGPDDDDWRRDFDAMVDYARAQGWTDEHGAVRAHLEEVGPSSP